MPRKKDSVTKHLEKREWIPADEKEGQVIRQFILLCESKMPVSVFADIEQHILNQRIQELKDGIIAFESIQDLHEEAFYDYVVGQQRLFDNDETSD